MWLALLLCALQALKEEEGPMAVEAPPAAVAADAAAADAAAAAALAADAAAAGAAAPAVPEEEGPRPMES